MTVVITSNEPKSIRKLFTDRIEMSMEFDFKLYTKSGIVGIERKKVPGDLISSIEDGRLGKQILAMREECSIKIVLLHGVMTYNKNGVLRQGKRTSSRWTAKGMRNLRRTLEFVEGCYIEYARNNIELVNVINEIQIYLDTPQHNSMHIRQGIRRDWIIPTNQERVMYWFQGLPKVGTTTAKKLYDKFPTPLSLFQASIEEICEVPKIGKHSATNIYNFLRSG